MIKVGLYSRSSICHGIFNLTAEGLLHTAKLRLTSFWAWLLANDRVLMKVLSIFLLPIPLDGKRERIKGAVSEKASSKAALLILPLHNSFEDALLLFLLHPLIISSSFCLLAAKLGIGIFGKDNAGKSRGDNPGNISADGGTRADDPGIKTDADVGADDSSIASDYPGIAIDDPSTKTDADV